MTTHEDDIYKILVEELWPGGITDGCAAAKEMNRTAKRLATLRSPEIRPTLVDFTVMIEKQLSFNDHKGGWETCNAYTLMDKLYEEVRELDRAVHFIGLAPGEEGMSFSQRMVNRRAMVSAEAGDVAAMAMMIAERGGNLKYAGTRVNGRPVDSV